MLLIPIGDVDPPEDRKIKPTVVRWRKFHLWQKFCRIPAVVEFTEWLGDNEGFLLLLLLIFWAAVATFMYAMDHTPIQ